MKSFMKKRFISVAAFIATVAMSCVSLCGCLGENAPNGDNGNGGNSGNVESVVIGEDIDYSTIKGERVTEEQWNEAISKVYDSSKMYANISIGDKNFGYVIISTDGKSVGAVFVDKEYDIDANRCTIAEVGSNELTVYTSDSDNPIYGADVKVKDFFTENMQWEIIPAYFIFPQNELETLNADCANVWQWYCNYYMNGALGRNAKYSEAIYDEESGFYIREGTVLDGYDEDANEYPSVFSYRFYKNRIVNIIISIHIDKPSIEHTEIWETKLYYGTNEEIPIPTNATIYED